MALPHHFDTSEFVEFIVKSNILLKELEEHQKTNAQKHRAWIKAYARDGIATLERLKLIMQYTGNTNDRYGRSYHLQNDKNVHLFGGFTVSDFADARYPIVRVNKQFQQAMIKLTDAVINDDKGLVLYTGFVLDPHDAVNKLRAGHSNGRAVDLLIDGMTAKQSYEHFCRYAAYADLNLVIKEFPLWVHIEYRANKTLHLPYTPTNVSCNSLIPVRSS